MNRSASINSTESNWIAKSTEYLPDFIIGGAMKSGTTTLHKILNSHPEIAIAKEELGFFDIDDILQHPDFNFFDKVNSKWTRQSMQENPGLLWDWYYSHFKKLNSSAKILGEDSTTYLCSERAAQRIAMQTKPIKLIFILRHPTERTISHYLHLLKSGRAIYSMENTLRYNPTSILWRSLYKEQLRMYYNHLPKDQIKVVLFEDLIKDQMSFFRDISEFLEIDVSKFSTEDFNSHQNKTKIPKHLDLQLVRNRWLRKKGDYRYSQFLPIQPDFMPNLPWHYRLIDKAHKKINSLNAENEFKVADATKDMLTEYFKIQMKGIDALTNETIYGKWFK